MEQRFVSLRYGSVCSGIEAATMAWHSLGWEPAFFSEIEEFPRAVLGHHYPDVPLHGNFTTIESDTYGSIDILVGGTPCVSFSIAGIRKGLDDDRGNLTLEFVRFLDKSKPHWFIWENVAGVLSSNSGKDFGSFLGALAECGYGWAYRICDAQFWGVAQRRRRVFVVGHIAGWRNPAAVLFESGGGIGSVKESRTERRKVAPTLTVGPPFSRTGNSRVECDALIVNERKNSVRRLTPIECERLQGFPDNFTQIPYRNKPASQCPDALRYRALGNSMAVPVMRWIGKRIDTVHFSKWSKEA